MSHLFIATPVYKGGSTGFWVSMMRLMPHMAAAGIETTFYPLCDDSAVFRARNVLEAEFQKSAADTLMFIDSDLAFRAEDVERLYRSAEPIIGGVYPVKGIPTKWPANFAGQRPDPATGLVEAHDVPTGFLVIRRSVLEDLRERHPELKCWFGEVEGYALFDSMIDPVTRHWLTEDFGFCRLAQRAGYRTMVDPDVRFAHRGEQDFVGCLTDSAYEFDIEGWMSPAELRWLEMTAATMGSVVEIGSWKGRSTNALLRGCKGPVYAVDHWQGSEAEREGPHAEAVTGDVFAQFMANVGHHENLVVMRGSSLKVAHDHRDNFDGLFMVFIDGGHTYAEVKADIEAWTPIASTLLCGHDYNEPEVRRAVDELLGPVENPVGLIWAKRIR